MKKCTVCSNKIEDDLKFCTKCGEKQEISETLKNDNKENNTATKKNTVDESLAMRKGIKNLCWNLKNMKKFTPKDNFRVSMQAVAVFTPILIVVSSIIVFLGFGISDKIEKSKRYTYMSTEAFIENWNEQAKNNPDGVTQGFVIDDSEDIDYETFNLNETDKIQFHTKGADVIEIELESSIYLEDAYDRFEKIEELIYICFPECSESEATKYIGEYKDNEAFCAKSGILGVRFSFEELEKEGEPLLKIETVYTYSGYITDSALPWNCEYDCTIEEYKENFNEKTKYLFTDVMVAPIADLVVAEKLIVDGRAVTTYGFDCVVDGNIIANGFIKADDESGKIFYCEYLLQLTRFVDDAQMSLCLKTLPVCIFSSLGFDEEIVYDLYIKKALEECVAENNYTVYFIGTNIHASELTNGCSTMSFLSCSEEYAEQLKQEGDVSSVFTNEVKNKTKTVENTKTESTEQSEESIVTEPTQSKQPVTEDLLELTENKFAGKVFVSMVDNDSGVDIAISNYISFKEDKAIIQMNLNEMAFLFEADYTIDGDVVTLGNGVTSETNMLICSEGVQFYFVSDHCIQITGMESRFCLSGWNCPYQFSEMSEFINK